MGIYLLGLAMLALAALLGFILYKTVAMAREGAPLIAVGSLRWGALPARRARAAPRPAKPALRARWWSRRPESAPSPGGEPLSAPAEPPAGQSADPVNSPPVRRNRALVVEAEPATPNDPVQRPWAKPAEAASADAEDQLAGLEGRLEAAFERFSHGTDSAARYIETMLAEREALLAGLEQAGDDAEPAATEAAREGLAMLDWCIAWAREQAANEAVASWDD